MSRLKPQKLQVRFASGTEPTGPVTPRRYTLTHSDSTGDLFLTIGAEYDRKQVSGWYTRLMRDEVLAEWLEDEDGRVLHVCCHVSGGLAIGPAGWRYEIFRRELPLVLEALRFGDQALYESEAELDRSPIQVHFHARQPRYNRTERWGVPGDYRLKTGRTAP
jgi:hypothetical protein